MPHKFWLWYLTIMPLLLAARLPYFFYKKWQYFLYDFCYFANFLMNVDKRCYAECILFY